MNPDTSLLEATALMGPEGLCLGSILEGSTQDKHLRSQACRAGPLSHRSSPIMSRASSPVLSTFGSGSIASGIARGSCLQSWHSSPVRLGSCSMLNSGSEPGPGAWRTRDNSPTLSGNGAIHQGIGSPNLLPSSPPAMTLDGSAHQVSWICPLFQRAFSGRIAGLDLRRFVDPCC